MKKILVVILLLCIAASITACTLKPITGDDFAQVMKDRGFAVEDLSHKEPLAQQVIVAQCKDYQLEFYLLADKSEAGSVYAGNKEQIKALPGGKTTTEVTGMNFSRFSCTVEGSYYLIAYVDNTFLFCKAAAQFEDQVDDHFEALGYK